MDWEDFYGCQLPVLESLVHSLSQLHRALPPHGITKANINFIYRMFPRMFPSFSKR